MGLIRAIKRGYQEAPVMVIGIAFTIAVPALYIIIVVGRVLIWGLC